MNLNDIFLFLTIISLHILIDFNLQGIMANMKRLTWWTHDPEYTEKYKHDYLAVLACHGFIWSFVVHLPLAVKYFYVYPIDSKKIIILVLIIIQSLCHSYIDDLKANKKCINLIHDQVLHFIQMLGSFLIVELF